MTIKNAMIAIINYYPSELQEAAIVLSHIKDGNEDLAKEQGIRLIKKVLDKSGSDIPADLREQMASLLPQKQPEKPTIIQFSCSSNEYNLILSMAQQETGGDINGLIRLRLGLK